MLSRRSFVGLGSGTLVGLALSGRANAAVHLTDLEALASASKLEASCRVFHEGRRVARLNLVAWEASPHSDSGLTQGMLSFEATRPHQLPEASYEVEHPVLGGLELFLQPAGTFTGDQHDGLQFRACVALLK